MGGEDQVSPVAVIVGNSYAVDNLKDLGFSRIEVDEGSDKSK